mgnify:FL=1
MSFTPYLFFSGNCAEAFRFYGDVFEAEPQVMTNADVPEGEGMPDAPPSTVMHAAIEFRGGFLMGSDDPTGDDGPKVGFSVAITAADTHEANRLFDALAAGGTVTMPISETFFSPAFGMLVDRFGIAWIVDTAPAEG